MSSSANEKSSSDPAPDSKSEPTTEPVADATGPAAREDSLPQYTSVPDSDAAPVTHTTQAPAPDLGPDKVPAPPKRPADPRSKVIGDLRDAFPNIEEKYITAVLIASLGNVDPAFNALLYISDPTFQPEIPTPRTQAGVPKPQTLTDDELLARKLQQEFEREDERRRRHRDGRHHSRALLQTDNANESPDEFEQIKETFTQGIEEARTTLNGWVSGLAKRLDSVRSDLGGEDTLNPKLFGALGGSLFQSDKVSKTARFDEDPHIIDDLPGGIKMDDNDTPPLPSRRAASHRPGALEKETIGARAWQPISTEQQANSDAFLVTDSEEEESVSAAAKRK